MFLRIGVKRNKREDQGVDWIQDGVSLHLTETPDEDDKVDRQNNEDHGEDVLNQVGWQQNPNLSIKKHA